MLLLSGLWQYMVKAYNNIASVQNITGIQIQSTCQTFDNNSNGWNAAASGQLAIGCCVACGGDLGTWIPTESLGVGYCVGSIGPGNQYPYATVPQSFYGSNDMIQGVNGTQPTNLSNISSWASVPSSTPALCAASTPTLYNGTVIAVCKANTKAENFCYCSGNAMHDTRGKNGICVDCHLAYTYDRTSCNAFFS